MKIRYDEIIGSKSKARNELIKLQNEVVKNELFLAEIEEARKALGKYRHSVKEVIELLKTAMYWRQKKSITTYNKMVQSLDRALVEYTRCRVYFKKFKAELEDINIHYDLEDIHIAIDLSGGPFVNLLFGGTDYTRQINRSLNMFDSYQKHIEEIKKMITNEKRARNKEVKKLQAKIQELVMTS